MLHCAYMLKHFGKAGPPTEGPAWLPSSQGAGLENLSLQVDATAPQFHGYEGRWRLPPLLSPAALPSALALGSSLFPVAAERWDLKSAFPGFFISFCTTHLPQSQEAGEGPDPVCENLRPCGKTGPCCFHLHLPTGRREAPYSLVVSGDAVLDIYLCASHPHWNRSSAALGAGQELSVRTQPSCGRKPAPSALPAPALSADPLRHRPHWLFAPRRLTPQPQVSHPGFL